MRVFSCIAIALALSPAACGLQTRALEPAPLAHAVPGSIMGSAIAGESGITVIARGDAWVGEPQSLVRHVTPIEVTLRNLGKKPLLVSYQQFSLLAHGRSYAVLNPFAGPARPVDDPAFPTRGFRFAPSLAAYFPGRPVAAGFPGRIGGNRPLAHDSLPSGDMLRQALPEGILDPGDEISGFLYFEKVRPDAGRVIFRADLLAAGSGERLGNAVIPFEYVPL